MTIVSLLMTMMKSIDNAIHSNCTEDIQCKLKAVVPVSKRFVTLRLEFSYAPIVTMVNVINGKYLPWYDCKRP